MRNLSLSISIYVYMYVFITQLYGPRARVPVCPEGCEETYLIIWYMSTNRCVFVYITVIWALLTWDIDVIVTVVLLMWDWMRVSVSGE